MYKNAKKYINIKHISPYPFQITTPKIRIRRNESSSGEVLGRWRLVYIEKVCK